MKTLPLSISYSPTLNLTPPLYNMSLGDVKKLNLELEVLEHTPALNTMPDTEMISVDQAKPSSTELEPCTQTDQMPVIGDTTLVTLDQLNLITESVWQCISQQLDAKCSWDSTKHEDAIEKLFELQMKFSDLSDKHKANMAKLVSLKREQDALKGENDSLKQRILKLSSV